MADEARGRLVISVDLELSARAGSLVHQRRLAGVTEHLLFLAERHALPLTLAVADPLHSAATEQIVSAPQHELAVLGDRSWIGCGVGRERFARELERRFHHARAAGLAVSSLCLRQAELTEHLDLLIGQGITALRMSATSEAAQPELLRFGMWRMPVSFRLPLVRRWWQTSAATVCARMLRQAVAADRMLHVAIDAGAVAEEKRPRLIDIERIFALAEGLRATGLKILTMQALAALLGRPHHGVPLRSLLRAA